MLTTYHTLCTEFYDLEEHKNHAPALDFFLAKAKQIGGQILEPMCGSGRFLIPLLEAGLDAEGFDGSEAMLTACTKKYAGAPVSQQLVQNFSSNKRYDLIFIPYGSWGLITDLSEAKIGLERLYEHLAPGGMLILEIETVASVPEHLDVWCRRTRVRTDGSVLALHALPTYDPQSQLFTAYCRYESIVDGTVQATEEEYFRQYLYREDELDVILAEAGFTKIKNFPAYNQTGMTDSTTPIIIYVINK